MELLTALPLMAIATGCAVLMLLQAAADRRAHSAAQASARELRHARDVLAAELAPLRARDLLTVSDTLLAVLSQFGVATVCAHDSLSIDVAAPPGAGSSAWLDATRAGDGLLAWGADAAVGATPIELASTLASGARRLGGGPCAAGVAAQRWRLTIRGFAGPALPLVVGAPLIIQREVQYVHYRSSGRWWLGRRTRDGATWETVQPVAGPLAAPARAPARGGVSLRGLTVASTPTARLDSIAGVALILRVPAGAAAPTRATLARLVLPPDSLVTELPLRGDAWQRGAP